MMEDTAILDQPQIQEQSPPQQPGPGKPILTDDHKKTLGQIILKMQQDKQPDDVIRGVVGRYKEKFGQPSEPVKPFNLQLTDIGKVDNSQPYIAPENKITADSRINDNRKLEKQAANRQLNPEQLANFYNRPSERDIRHEEETKDAVNLLNKELDNSDDVISDIVKKKQMEKIMEMGRNIITDEDKKRVVDEQVKMFTQALSGDKSVFEQAKQEALTDPIKARMLLSKIANKHPEKAAQIKKAMYLNDFQNRANPTNIQRGLDNGDDILNGKSDYNIVHGQIYKPQGVIDSFLQGTHDRGKEMTDFNQYMAMGKDGDKYLMDLLDKENSSYDPDKPIPISEGALSHLSEMTGSNAIPLIRGGIVGAIGTAAGSLIGNPEIGPILSAAANTPEYAARAFMGSIKQNYNNFLSAGVEKKEAFERAKKQAIYDAAAAGAQGAIQTYAGFKLGSSATTGFKWSPNFRNVMTGILKEGKEFGKEAIKSIVPNSAIIGGLEASKNVFANAVNGEKRPLSQNVWNSVGDNAFFELGLGMLGKGFKIGKEISSEQKNSILQNISKQPDQQIDAKLGTMLKHGDLTQEEVLNAKKLISVHREEASTIPAHITDEKTIQEIKYKQQEFNQNKQKLSKVEEGGLHEGFHPPIKERQKELQWELNLLQETPENQIKILQDKKIELEGNLKPNEEGKIDLPKLEKEKYQKQLKDINNRLEEVNNKINDPVYKAKKELSTFEKISGTDKAIVNQYGEEGFLQYLAQQAQGIDQDGNPQSVAGPAYDAMIKQGYPKKLIDAAIEAYPAKDISSPNTKTNEEASNNADAQAEGKGQIGQETVSETSPIPGTQTPEGPPDEVKPSVSVIKPEDNKAPNVVELKKGTSGGKEATPISSLEESAPIQGEPVRLSHAETEKIYKEGGLPERLETPTKTREVLDTEARKLIDGGYDFNKKAKDVLEGKGTFEDVDQAAFDMRVSELKNQQKGLKITDPEFDKIQNQIETLSRASDVAGTISGRALQARRNYEPNEETISDFVSREKEASGVNKLTEKQKEQVQKEFDEFQDAKAKYEEQIARLEEENTKLKAEKEVAKNKPKTKSNKTAEDFAKERQEIKERISERLRKSRGNMNSFTTAAVDFLKITPDVLKLVKSYVEEGGSKLADVIKAVHKDLKDDIEGLTEKDVQDIIAGKYSEKKEKTVNDARTRLKDIQDEAKLINRLEELENGEEPKTEKDKVKRNREITQLQGKIKEYKRIVELEKELDRVRNRREKIKTDKDEKPLSEREQELLEQIEKERKDWRDELKMSPEQRALQSRKTRLKKEADQLEEDLKNGNYQKPEKKSPLKLDKEAQVAYDRLIKLKQERELRLAREQYAKRTFIQKAKDAALEVLNVPRTIMSSVDFSAPLRQGLIPTIAHPKEALGAAAEMFKQSLSQKRFDRWFSNLRESPEFKVMEASKLYVADPHNPKLTAKEELFMNNLAEKIPLIGKLVKGSERAYVAYLNKMRVDLFNKGRDLLEAQGKTFENSEDTYKALASWVNNSTGRGQLYGKVENAAPLLNTIFFSPRLIASRLNLLNPLYYAKLPKEIRISALKDMGKFIGFGITVMAIAKLNGAQVEDDPRSTDFGKIKVGDTRYDIWGGFQQYIRLFAQIATGQKKSTTSGDIKELDGKKAFGETRADVGGRFVRGKLAPVPSMGVDFLAGRDATGNKLLYQWGGDHGDKEITLKDEAEQHFLPLIYSDVKDAAKGGDWKSAILPALASTFGVGTQTYNNSGGSGGESEKSNRTSHSRSRD